MPQKRTSRFGAMTSGRVLPRAARRSALVGFRSSGTDHYVFSKCGGFGNRKTVFGKPLNVHLNRLKHVPLGLVTRRARGDAAWQVGRVRGVIPPGVFDDDEEPVRIHFRPACLMM